jgi:galactose-1-phosphate uridylyltransferase
MNDILQNIENLLNYEIEHLVITPRDYIYVKNKICYLLKVDSSENLSPQEIEYVNIPLDNIVDPLNLT